MRRSWWEIAIGAALLLLVSMSINCADLIGADPVEGVLVVDEQQGQENAYTCECELTVFGGDEKLPDKPAYTVCASEAVGRDPQSGKLNVTDINQDCQARVATTFAEMANACSEFGLVEARCFAAVEPARFEQACKQEGRLVECPRRGVKADCSNFDPDQPEKSTATLPGSAGCRAAAPARWWAMPSR